jgi:disulfide bond formation protein DsbB
MRYQLKLPEFGRWHTLTLKHKINQITFLHKMDQLGTFYRTTLLLLLLSTLGRTQNPKHGMGMGIILIEVSISIQRSGATWAWRESKQHGFCLCTSILRRRKPFLLTKDQVVDCWIRMNGRRSHASQLLPFDGHFRAHFHAHNTYVSLLCPFLLRSFSANYIP